jgi:nitrogenase molybdenum-iron protein alpha/beta subunit
VNIYIYIYVYIECRVDKTIEKDIWSLCEKASAINKVYEAKLNVSNTNSSSPRGNYNF